MILSSYLSIFFTVCTALAKVTFTDGIIAIADSAFFDCRALETVEGTKDLVNLKLFGDLNNALLDAGVTVPDDADSEPDYNEIINDLHNWSEQWIDKNS